MKKKDLFILLLVIGLCFPVIIFAESINIKEAQESFEEIKQANVNKDRVTYDQYLTKKTLETFSQPGWEMKWYKDLTFVKAIEDGERVIITITSVEDSGLSRDDDFVFVKEDGVWKMGVIESMEESMKQMQNKVNTAVSNESSNGFIDFIVTDVKVYPEHPKVNNFDTVIRVFIKNIGTKTAKKGISALVQFVSDGKEHNGDVSNLDPLGPGETATLDYRPYMNPYKKDKAGIKKANIFINEDKSVIEKDYSNNTFIKKVEFFE